MFAKALIGIGVSLALLGGSAAGQRVSLCDMGSPRVMTQEWLQLQRDCATPQADRTIWPTNIWASGTVPEESAGEVQSLIDDAMARAQDDVMGESRQIVVIHKGRLVAESYREGYAASTKLVSWSMAKSITQALVGRAMMEGLIEDIDVPMPGPWAEDDPRSDITWRQWMTMTDGLDYAEVGEVDLAKNDVVQMMFGPGRFDMVGYVKGLEQIHAAGTHWNYSTATFHMISRALQRQMGLGECSRSGNRRNAQSLSPVTSCAPEADTVTVNWLNETLFTPLGMDAQPEFDAAGTFLGGSLVYASARDFARFGYLYLRDGVWHGYRLLPGGWVDFATTAHEGTDTNVYGAGWWITPDEGEPPTHPQAAISAPYDAFHAGGNEGQTIWVVPSKDLVIVRLGLMSNAPENWAALYEWNQKMARAFPDVE